jgi:hypothetical protein
MGIYLQILSRCKPTIDQVSDNPAARAEDGARRLGGPAPGFYLGAGGPTSDPSDGGPSEQRH